MPCVRVVQDVYGLREGLRRGLGLTRSLFAPVVSDNRANPLLSFPDWYVGCVVLAVVPAGDQPVLTHDHLDWLEHQLSRS
jgi:hypothetical protein